MRNSKLQLSKGKCFSFCNQIKLQTTLLKTKKKVNQRRKSDTLPNALRKIQDLIEENTINHIEQLREKIGIWRNFSSAVAQGWKKLIQISQNGQQYINEDSHNNSFNLNRRRAIHKIERTAFQIVEFKCQASNKTDQLSNEMIEFQKLRKKFMILVQKQRGEK